MKKIIYKIFFVISTIILYFVFGLNAVKLLLFFIPQIIGLPKSISNNPLLIFIVIVVLSPIVAGVLTYRFLLKLIKAEESRRIIKITLTIIVTLACIKLLIDFITSFYKIINGFY